MEPISYFTALLTDPHLTTLQFLHMPQAVEVARVYVPLRLSQERRPGYEAPASDAESAETAGADDPILRIEEERQRRERSAEAIYDPEKAMHAFQRCVITGDAGAGKTMLLRHLAIMAAQRSIAGLPSPLPVYVALPSFVRSGLHDLLDFVSATWEGAYALPAQQARLLLANFLDEGQALLLLDALDEAPAGETPQAADQSYEAASQAILALVARYPKASVAVTARKASYKQHRPLAGFTALEVMNLRFDDAKQLIRNWYEAAYDGAADARNGAAAQKSAALIKRLDAHPHLQKMAANPLLLTLMMLADVDHPKLPERRAELYRICIETALRNANIQLGQRKWREFEPEQKHQLLKAIAWHFHRKRQRYVSEHDLLRVIAELLPAINVPAQRSKDMLQEIEGEQGVLQWQPADWYGFQHLSLQEYFAAAYINDHQEDAELYRHRADAWWEEVLLLYMEMTPDASLFLRRLCPQKSIIREDIFYTNVLLAGRCLRADPVVEQAGLRTHILERLFELMMSTRYSLLRQEAIGVVCSIGGVETKRRLVTLLSDERVDVHVRWNIAEALGASGERSVASDLAQLLSDERLHAFVRWNIAEALGTLGERSVAGELVRLLSHERLHTELRRGIADALGRLGETSTTSELLRLLADERLDVGLRKNIANALGRLEERSIASELLQLLADERLDVGLRRSIAEALGRLGERSVVEGLVQLLADDLLDADLRRSIADALAMLGEWSMVADAMVELLADDQQDVFVRRRITGALGTLAEVSGSLTEGSERPVARNLVQLLADEWLDADLRWSIADVLGMLGDRSVVKDLAQLLSHDLLDVNVRRAIALALGRLGERTVAARAMVELLADERQDVFARRSIADALGRLGERSVAGELVQMLSDERVDVDLRWSIADALGRLGERAVTGELSQLLADERRDVFVRRSIAGALASLGERAVAARAMLKLLSDDRFGVFARRSIADALGRLGEPTVASDMAQLLADERLHAFIRQSIADALGRLGEPSVTGRLVHLLADERLDADLRRSIAGALAAYADDISTVEGMIKSLQDEAISDSVYRALWIISRRAGVWIFPVDLTTLNSRNGEQAQAQYEIVRWK